MAKSWVCPFCEHAILLNDGNTSFTRHEVGQGNKHESVLVLKNEVIVCPNPDCKEYSIFSELLKRVLVDGQIRYKKLESWKLRPSSVYKSFPEYVPQAIRQDYEEACEVLEVSPKASATLSRRCLQGIIRDFWGISERSLASEIRKIEAHVDPITWKAIDSVRSVGNVGAHMEKDINLIIDVDIEEAKALVRLLEVLIKEWYVHRHERNLQMQHVIDVATAKQDEKSKANSY